MDIAGFTKTGNWYKGNIHCHTTNSDGCLSPEEVVKIYKEKGYSFLAISDHDLYSDYRKELNSPEFILLPAIEATAVLYKDREKTERLCLHHIHGILGTEEMERNAPKGTFSHLEKYPPREYYETWDGGKVGQELQQDLEAHGCITIYNHPVWSRVKEEEFTEIRGLAGLEIYNYGTVNESGTGFDTVHWDIMLRRGVRINGTAADDNHNDGIVEDSFGGYIVVKAESLEHQAVIQAILEGNYYSSTGPEIYDWGIKDNIAYVECSQVERVNFMAGNYINAGGTRIFKSEQKPVMRAEFPLKGNEQYIRVECIDQYGRTAWSNPIFLS